MTDDRANIWDAISEACSSLSRDELAVIAEVAQRMLRGKQQYGTLDLARDERDFVGEARAEVYDLLAYVAMDSLRGRR